MEFQQFEKYTILRKEHTDYLSRLSDHVKHSPYRPSCHICPPCGLMNDPNGLCYYEGWYHVFYQWYPFGAEHGMKHWAHVKSKDLISWEWCQEMLIPDREYEKNGCYSGNAFVNNNDRTCYLYYTANYKTEDGRMPKQALAIMDRNGQIEKYGSAPLIDETPEGMSGDIRDPFVFERDNSYWMMLGGADKQEQGQLLIYHSSDLKKWGYKGRVKIPIHLGTMVECPGIISINGKDVLFLSLMGIEPQGDRFLNQFSSIYLIGELDLNHMDFHMDSYGEVDCGFDFYAPQVFYGKDSEPLMFGWFGCGDQILPTDFDRWRHGLTMPRQLSVENGNLYAVPVKQMEELYEEITIVDERNFHPQAKKCWKTELAVSKEDGIRNYRFGKEEDYWTLTIDAIHGIVTWDRSGLKQVISPEYGMIRTCQVTITKTLTVKLYNDNSFIEIYINKGEKVMSGRVFPL